MQITTFKQKTINFYDRNYSFWLKNTRYSIRFEYLSLLGKVENKRILDVGCGLGIDAQLLSQKGAKGVGIDFSQESVKIAKGKNIENWNFFNIDSELINYDKFDFVISIMELMYHEDLNKTATIYCDHLVDNGKLLLVINNPYLISQNYSLNYNRECLYTHRFDSLNDENYKIHRPIDQIVKSSCNNQMNLIDFHEMYCNQTDCQEYNQKNKLIFPDFHAILFEKSNPF